MRGITLEEIAESTKIGNRSLKALEDEDFEKLPGGIFNKGFVRAYARYLGLDEEQAVADFLAAAGTPEQPIPTPATRSQAYPAASSVEASVNWRGVAMLAVIGLVVVVAAWKVLPVVHRAGARLWHGTRARLSGGNRAPAPPPITFRTDSKPAVPAAQLEAQTAPGAAPAAVPAQVAASDGFVVSIKAKKDSWVWVTADGKPFLDGLLTAAAEKQVHARSRVVLKAADPAGVEVSWNGKPLPPLGPDNQVTTVIFTPDGLQR